MIKKLKPAILLLIAFMMLHGTYCSGQVNIQDYLKQRFLKYCENVPREEIYVHSDRDEYISGENLWFNIYLIDRKDFKPSLNSKIVYFEVLNSENRPVVQKRIMIDKGFGPGQIVLPDSLSSGIYIIRAYTSWMKNFLPFNCFMKDIKVYNAFNTRKFNGKPGTIDRLAGAPGNEVFQGQYNNGLTLKVNNLKTDTLEIIVTSTENYRYRNNNIFYLFIQTHGIINRVSSEKIVYETTKITVPKNLLTPGINQITLFDSKGLPICERYNYTPDLHNQSVMIHSEEYYNTRSKVSLEIEAGVELLPLMISTNLSISVAPASNWPDAIDLYDFLIFGTEFGVAPAEILRGSSIGKLSTGEIDSLMLSIKSNWIDWGRILSGELARFKYKPETEYHYLFGKLLNRDQKAVGSNEFILLSSPGKEAVFHYAKTDINGDFNFRIPIDKGLKDLLMQPDEVIKNQIIKLESSFSDQFMRSEGSVTMTNEQIPDYISRWSINYQVQKLYGSSYLGNPLNPGIPPLKPKRFYGKPDVEIVLADYIKLPVMQEVFFELMPGIFLKNKKTGYEITISDPLSNKLYETPPALMVDGVLISNASIIANLDPEIVEKIDVVNEQYFVGDYSFFGIVNVISKTGNYSCVTMPEYAVRMPYKVTDPVMSFASPDYTSGDMKNRRIPDFRNTLYWNPSVIPGKDGRLRVEFWTSDIASDYIVNIQGITAEGKTVTYKKIIRVK
jgi:hypothetical protein